MYFQSLLRRVLLPEQLEVGSKRTTDAILFLEPRQLLDALVWTGAAGDNLWHTAGNWLNVDYGVVGIPNGLDDVTIDVPGSPTILFNSESGEREVRSLVLRENLTLSGGSLTIRQTAHVQSALLSLSGGDIHGGTWNFASGGSISLTPAGGTLNNSALNTELELGESATVLVSGTTTFTAARLTGGGANLRFAGGYTLSVPVTAEGPGEGTRTVQLVTSSLNAVTVAPSGSIRLLADTGGDLIIAPITGGLVNNGHISMEAAGRALTLNPNNFTNNGTLSVSGGALNVTGTNWSNAGAITATASTVTFAGSWSSATGTLSVSASTLNLGGNFTTAGLNLADFARAGGTVNLTGTLSNAANTLTLNSSTGSWNLIGGAINGGEISFANGATLLTTSSGGTLRDLTVNGDLTLGAAASLTLGGNVGIAAVRLTGGNADLRFTTLTTFTGIVLAEGAAAGTRYLTINNNATMRLSADGELRMADGLGGNMTVRMSGGGTLVNNGLITAAARDRTLTIDSGTFTNNSTMHVSLGTLTLNQFYSFVNTGEIAVSGGVLNLGGRINAIGGIGAWNRTGGTVNITGEINNCCSSTITLNRSTGSWRLSGGIITGGMLGFADGAELEYSGAGGTLNGVTVIGDVVLGQGASLTVQGWTRFNAARLIGNATLSLAAGYMLSNPVYAEGAAAGTRTVRLVTDGGTATIGPMGSIRLMPGTGGNLNLSHSLTGTLVNNGLISAEAALRTLTINPSVFTNNATVRVTTGALTLNPSNPYANAGEIIVSDGVLNLGGTFNVSSGVGTWNRTGGTVNVTGTILNQGPALAMLDSSTGSWRLLGATISGGTMNLSGGAQLHAALSGATLNNVTVNGDVVVEANATLTVQGTAGFTAARMVGGGANIQLPAGYVLNSLITAEGIAAGTRSISFGTTALGTYTIGPSGSIRLLAGSGGGLSLTNPGVSITLVNNGLISAEAVGQSLSISTSINTFTNNGVVRASAGTLFLGAAVWSNPGAITSSDATLNLLNNWSNAGTLSVTNTTLNLYGNFSTLGFNFVGFARTGGAVNLSGSMNNNGSLFKLNAVTGSWNLLNGSISGGSISFANGSELVYVSGGSLTGVTVFGNIVLHNPNNDVTLNYVTVAGEVVVPAHSWVQVSGTTRFTTTRLTGTNATLRMTNGYVLHDHVTSEGTDINSRIIVLAAGGTGTNTISPTGSIRMLSGSGGGLTLRGSGQATTLINNGLISAEAATRMISLSSNISVFTNSGVVRAVAGLVWILSTTTNYAAAVNTLTGGAWEVLDGASLSIASATIRTLGPGTRVLLSGPASSFPSISTLTINNGTLEVAAGRNLDVAPVGGTFQNNGTFAKHAGGTSTVSAAITFNNNGLVNVTGGTLAFGGAAAQVPQVSGTTLVGGSWRVDDTAGLGAALLMPAGVTLSVIGNGATVTFAGAAPSFPALQNVGTNNGTLIFADNASFLLSPPADTLANTGTIRKSGAGTLTLPSSLTINNGVGTVEAASGGLVIDGNVVGGTVRTTGEGTLHLTQDTTLNAALLVNNGVVNLGVHTLTLAGAYTQGPAGLLESGVVTESQMGNILAAGAISLGGTLRVSSVGGFDPAFGNILFGLDVVRGDSRTGEFAEADLPSTAVGAYAIRYFSNRAELIFNIADFNGDGGVDGADIEAFTLLWQDGSMLTDINGDGGVDGADIEAFLTIWERGGE